MKKITEKLSTKILTLGLALALFLGPVSASAQTTVAQLEAQIAQLRALIAAFSGNHTVTMTFTRDLTIGSTGADVTALQNWLISRGFSIPAGATGYFGVQTRGAVAAYQASAGITPTAGYFGPITRSRVNATIIVVNPPSTPGNNNSNNFFGSGEGFLDEFDQISSFSNEEVGEDEEDVEVIGVSLQANDSDQMIDRLIVEIDTPTGNDDLEDFISDVSVWLDGEEIGRMDVDEASHDSGNDEYTFRFTGLEGVIDEDDEAELTVAVSGTSGLDSADEGDGWTITIPEDGIRALSPNRTDDTYASSAYDETFTLDSFASATGVELQVSLSNDSPDASVVDVSDTDDTDNVELLRFTFEAEGSDLTITELPITLTTTGGASISQVANRLTLEVDGDDYAETVSGGSSTGVITFDNLDITIQEGDEMEFTISADINDLEGSFSEGDTLKAEVTSTNRDNISAEDESGEDLENNDKSGTALGDAIAFFDTGVQVTFVSATESVSTTDGSDNDTGTFTIKYRVTAQDGTIYVSNSADATVSTSIADETISGDGVLYLVEGDGSAVTTGLSDIITYKTINGNVTNSSNGVRLDEGETAEFTLTVTRTNTGSGSDDGLYRMMLKAVGWNTNDSTTWNVYDFELSDYKTDPVSLN